MAGEFSFAPLEAAPPPPPPGRSPDDRLAALARAEAEADAIRLSAHAEGLAAGRAEALAAAAPAAAALDAALAGAREEHAAAAERHERSAVGLALLLAEKVVGGAVAVEPERVLEAIRGALRGIVERERIIVQVNPDDLELVREAMLDIRGSLGGIEHCEVQAERRIARGGAMVRTPDGDVDARLETKLARAFEVVEAALSEQAA
jgi:flagellar assembly protein FliH